MKFHTPIPKEDPTLRFVVLEIHFDIEKPRAKIKELNGGKSFASISVSLVEDLEVVEVDTEDLIGQYVDINKADNSKAKGKVVKVSEEKVLPDLTKGVKGVETNVWLTIVDENGKEHIGTLFVNSRNALC